MAWQRKEQGEDRPGVGGEDPRREPVVDVEYSERPAEDAPGGGTPPPPPPPREGRRGVSMPRMILGIFIVLVGVSILVQETDILRYLFPILLMVFGLLKIFGTRSSSSRILGTILLFLGFMFLIEAWSLWPILIILLGLNILWKGVGRDQVRRSSGRTMSGSAFVKDFVLFGGSERVVDSPDFEGGDISAVFGGVDLDLRGADIAPDREAVVDLFVLFGSTEITVPPSWDVSQEATAIFGSVDDQTRTAVSGPVADGRRRRLVIRGYALFGGIDIKN